MLKLEATTVEEVWAGIEDYARDDWRTPDELHSHHKPRWTTRGGVSNTAWSCGVEVCTVPRMLLPRTISRWS